MRMPKFGLEDLSVQLYEHGLWADLPSYLPEVDRFLETEENIGKMALATNCESVPETAGLHLGSVQQPRP